MDRILGDPEVYWHPVRLIGLCAENFKKIFFSQKKKGGFLTLFFTSLFFLVSIHFFKKYFPWIEGIVLYFLIAEKALRMEALKVYKYLSNGSLEKAREVLAFIVSRETKELSKSECIRASVETVAENFSDAFVGPLFYYLLGGLELAVLYKVIETLDSMYGYKIEEYKDFGFFPAKADDFLNFIPSRLAALFLLIAAALEGFDFRRGFRIIKKDARKHDSPNAGWPEAAIAGILGIRLGGLLIYKGKRLEKAFLGEKLRKKAKKDILLAVFLLKKASFLFFIFIFLGEVILWRLNCPNLILAIMKGLKGILII